MSFESQFHLEELQHQRVHNVTTALDGKDTIRVWLRPFKIVLREPIIIFLLLLSRFSEALILTSIEPFNLVYKQ